MFWIVLTIVKQYFIAEVISFETRINVISVTKKGLLHSFDLPKAVCLEFSPKNKDWLNGYKNKTPTYVVYKRPTSKQGTHTD